MQTAKYMSNALLKQTKKKKKQFSGLAVESFSSNRRIDLLQDVKVHDEFFFVASLPIGFVTH